MPAPPIDYDLLAVFNRPGNPLLDSLMRIASSGVTLIAVAVGLGLYIYFRSPQKLYGVLIFILAITASDMIAARVFKPWAERVRPCNVQPPASVPVGECQHGVSFPSNHAANAAAVATIVSWAAPRLSAWCIPLAILVGISRVYLGQHWPTDVFAGWGLGGLVAFLLIQAGRLRYLASRSSNHLKR